jgi:hypothetical protein
MLPVLLAPALAQEGSGLLTPEEFPILPWSWAPNDQQQLEWIRDCGFNLAGFVRPEALDAVQAVGLKAFVSDGSLEVGDAEAKLDDAEIARRVHEVVAKVNNHPAAFGYYFRDEPSASVYLGLGRWAVALAKEAPNALAYINLFPNYASPEQLGTPTYAEYLSQFVSTVKPRFISYDHYALMDDGTLRGGYFQNLEAVRDASLAAGIPFWNIVLSNAHFHYAEPSPAGLRFQLYTTLAYGARGISYFTYFAPDVGNYRLAPVDQFGNKTPTWDMLRNVNLQLHKLGPTYLKLKSVNVFHHGQVPEGCLDDTTSVNLAEVSGGELLVGEFTGADGHPAVLVVNKDLHNSTSFGARFKQPGQVMMVNPYTGALQPFAGENGWLAAGQGTLLVLGG